MNQLGDLHWQSTNDTSVLIRLLCSTSSIVRRMVAGACTPWPASRLLRVRGFVADPLGGSNIWTERVVEKAAAREHAPRWRPRLSGQRRPFFARRKVEEEEEGEGRKQVRRAQVAFWLVLDGGRKKASFFSSQASRSEAAVAPRGFR